MGHGVVADEVAGGGNGAGDLRTLADEAADQEERSSDFVAGEDFEEPFGSDVVGAVVVGEGDLVGVAAGDENGSEDLRLGRKGRVGEKPCGGGCRGEEGGGGLGLRHLLLPPSPLWGYL